MGQLETTGWGGMCRCVGWDKIFGSIFTVLAVGPGGTGEALSNIGSICLETTNCCSRHVTYDINSLTDWSLFLISFKGSVSLC